MIIRIDRLYFLFLVLFITKANTEDITENTNISDQNNTISIAQNVSVTDDVVLLNDSHTINETSANITEIVEEPNDVTNKTQKLVHCVPLMGSPEVQLMNDTELIKLLQADPKVTERDVPGLCVVVLFYSKYCPFSTIAAPHYNALPRAFPDVKLVAINAMMYHLFNTQNGIVGVPSLLLFHNGRSVGKFNGSEYTLEKFSQFIFKHTGIPAVESVAVTSADFAGPVTNIPAKEYDLFLILSWFFIILCGGYYFTKSRWWKWIIESVQSNWRDSEVHAQHEHLD